MAAGGREFCRRNYTIDMEERSTGEIDMKKMLTICAMVAALGAASGSVQARPSAAADPAAAAIRALGLGQVYNQPNATRSPDEAPGACYRERPLNAWGFNFRLPQRTVC